MGFLLHVAVCLHWMRMFYSMQQHSMSQVSPDAACMGCKTFSCTIPLAPYASVLIHTLHQDIGRCESALSHVAYRDWRMQLGFL